MSVHALSGSVRVRPIEQTLRSAERAAAALGVTRCIDATRLDRVGIPVFSATRPRAPMICVTAGKGLHADEARTGALMEAIEQQVAHQESTVVAPEWMTAREAVERGGPKLGSLAPRLGATLALDRPMAWVTARDLETSSVDVPLPAELVLTPCPPALSSGMFGSSTTGLASGNTFHEATLHGLCEVLERDITSFEAVQSTSRLVRPRSLPEPLAGIHGRMNEKGLRTWLRWVPSPFGIAYFSALVVDDEQPTPLYCNGGYGCHPSATIAAARALTEAAQSRVSFIQGAREDLADAYAFFEGRTDAECDAHRARLVEHYSDMTDPVDFEQIPTRDPGHPHALIEELLDRMRGSELGPAASYAYTAAPRDLPVVRVVVPGAEQFRTATARVGARLVRHARARRAAAEHA